MAWVPLEESGISFSFSSSAATMVNSHVVVDSELGPSWSIELNEAPVTLRVSAISYGSNYDFNLASFDWPAGNQTNEAADPFSSFAPANFEALIESAGQGLSYNPSSGSEEPASEEFDFLIEASVDVQNTCQELGRVTRAYVSGYNRARVHQSRLYASERRCLVANFNGAIPVGLTISSVKWQTNQNWAVVMADARIDGREVMVNITAQITGTAVIRCTVTLSNEERYTQLFNISVRPQPYYLGDTYVLGPTSLEATAP